MANPYTLNTGSMASGTSFTVTGSASMAAGDVLVVNIWTAQAVTSVTDSQNNSYVLVNARTTAQQWVTAGKTVALSGTDHITITTASAGAGNAVVVGVPGAVYAPSDATGSASGTGTSASVTSDALITADGQTAIALVASAASVPTWTGTFSAGALGTSHGASTEFIGAAYAAGVTAPVTATATLTTGAWIALVVTLQMTSFVNATPAPPVQYAGRLATSADMNSLAQTALYLRRPPMVVAQSATSGTGQSMTSTPAGVQFTGGVLRDTDGFFAPANNTRLTVRTPGFYRVRYSVPFDVAAQNCQCMARVTTGSNNPAGAGVTSSWWYAWAGAANSINGCACGGGIIPVYLYVLDYVEILQNVVTTSNMPVTPQPAIASLRMVSL